MAGETEVLERQKEMERHCDCFAHPFLCTNLERTTWVRRGHVIMAAGGASQPGRFHLKCSRNVHLNTSGTTAWTKGVRSFGVAFSKESISKGQMFSAKVLKPGVVSSGYTTVVS